MRRLVFMLMFMFMAVPVFMGVTMVAAAGISVGRCPLRGDPHLGFHIAYDLLQPGQQTVGIFGSDPQLLCGEGNGSFHLGQSVDLRFHFGGTVGAAEILQGIALGNQIRPSLTRFYI
jgi:hypothetical protein